MSITPYSPSQNFIKLLNWTGMIQDSATNIKSFLQRAMLTRSKPVKNAWKWHLLVNSGNYIKWIIIYFTIKTKDLFTHLYSWALKQCKSYEKLYESLAHYFFKLYLLRNAAFGEKSVIIGQSIVEGNWSIIYIVSSHWLGVHLFFIFFLASLCLNSYLIVLLLALSLKFFN